MKMTKFKEMATRQFWTEFAAEFLATMVLVLVVCGSSLTWDKSSAPPAVIHTALTAGMSIATAILMVGHISGGHVNPSVTIAMLVARKISVLRGIFYVLAQVMGGMTISYKYLEVRLFIRYARRTRTDSRQSQRKKTALG